MSQGVILVCNTNNSKCKNIQLTIDHGMKVHIKVLLNKYMHRFVLWCVQLLGYLLEQ